MITGHTKSVNQVFEKNALISFLKYGGAVKLLIYGHAGDLLLQADLLLHPFFDFSCRVLPEGLGVLLLKHKEVLGMAGDERYVIELLGKHLALQLINLVLHLNMIQLPILSQKHQLLRIDLHLFESDTFALLLESGSAFLSWLVICGNILSNLNE